MFTLHKTTRNFLSASVLLSFLLQILLVSASAQRLAKKAEAATPEVSEMKRKFSPELEENTNDFYFGRKSDEVKKVIIRLKSSTNLNEMFGNNLDENSRRQLFAQETSANKSRSLLVRDRLREANGTFKKSLNNLGLISAELPLSKIRELSENSDIEYISEDGEVESFGHIGDTLGYKQLGISDRGDTNPNTWLAGAGITIAVIDSGVYGNHNLLKTNGIFRVTNYNFTGGGDATDKFGHGTHVAAIAVGDWVLGNTAYEGIAESANVVSLKALDDNGLGNVSSVVSAIDWAIANKTAKNIRVINMSLGMPAKDSYKNDPLCLAARRAVNAGIVVVASAGNFGKDLLGNKIYGGINTPGIEPSVITVGASNTFGTTYRSDDKIATFSSRGPTRGYVTLSNGARKFDNLIKPDLVAPGNRIISASSPYSKLITLFPTLKAGNYVNDDDKVMYLSGTSMAAPVVAGAATILVDTNPNLTPNLIKAILMYSAQPIKGFNTFEQGAGEINIEGAVRLARLIKDNPNTLTNGAAMLKASLPTSQTSTIWGETCYWGKGIITNYGILYGDNLMKNYQGMYANGVLVADSTPYASGVLTKSATLTSGANLYQGSLTNNGVLVSDGVSFITSTAMAGTPTPIVNSQGVLVSDGVLVADGVLVSDGVLVADCKVASTQAILGDNTTAMQPAP